ncbi:hypothetical protein EZ428_16140 [Pedobacter frigiditerrae]|uniref:histidine kinase n=1 Tax=Pedobacter frigiditerrae TaxID=2530452 RepID=A0A4V2MI67_9SPHI|nr:histidine kinase dimerization/phosphoacceptor domain -containing protein [Pedobacter frigiditerrae]TCC89226.1 hypothetical protein EZ428_16140 [Pedobacter frigiditerrae]
MIRSISMTLNTSIRLLLAAKSRFAPFLICGRIKKACFRHILLAFICLMCTSAVAQQHQSKGYQKLSTKDTLRVKNLLDKGYEQLDQYLDQIELLDSAILFAKRANSLSVNIGYAKGMDFAKLLEARVYLAKGDIKTTKGRLKNLGRQSQVALWISLAKQAVARRRTKENIDSTFIYLHRADAIAKNLGSTTVQLMVKSQFAMFQLTVGDTDKGVEIYKELIRTYELKGDERMAGRTLTMLVSNLPHLAKYSRELISGADRCIKIYTKLNHKDTIAMIMLCKANFYRTQNDNTLAEKELLPAIELFKVTKSPVIVYAYASLANICIDYGNNEKALRYYIESINAAVKYKQTSRLAVTYQQLGALYLAMNQLDKSMETFKLAFELVEKKTRLVPGEALVLVRSIADVMGRNGKVVEALDFIDKMEKKYPPQPGPEQTVLPVIRGGLYAKLGKFDIAEKYYLDAVQVSDKLGSTFKNKAIDLIAGFYLRTRQWDKAKPYLETLKNIPHNVLTANDQRNIQLYLYRIDSAGGNYASALNHFLKYKAINDTIYNTTNKKRYLELQIQYETDKKDKDILLKQKNIQILEKQDLLHQTLLHQTSLQMRLDQQKRQQELKISALEDQRRDRDFTVFRLRAAENDQNIKRLEKEAKLQQTLLSQAKINKGLTYGGILLLAIVVSLLLSRYRLKQRANKLLNAQKEEISQQNRSLQELVEKKESLIIEKEWLVKEIHHRVKNNLQIVISLLRAQTDYLDNDVALLALKQSQHRMQAMSMIHQRLYQSESMSCINIRDYVSEMVAYFSDSMNRDTKVIFEIDMLPLSLDIGQAIPLGLILNESITNAIKYAFEDTENPKIEISLAAIGEDALTLMIKDNGKGLVTGFDPKKAKSLGMSLILGLSKQLGGNCSFLNNNGLSIHINFKVNLMSGETAYLSVMAS